MDQQLSVINTAIVFSSTTNDFLNCDMHLEKKGGAEIVVNFACIFDDAVK